VFVMVDRKGGRPVDEAFRAEIAAFLERFRLAGHDVVVEAPLFVPLDVALSVCVSPGYRAGDVEAALLRVLGAADNPDGTRGLFHPDNLTFGTPVYLSQVVAAAMAVPGVHWVDLDDTPPKKNRFQRWGELADGEIAAGVIRMGRFEIPRLDNDPDAPENGQLTLLMEGGS
jgi:putative intracellular protease/amidase